MRARMRSVVAVMNCRSERAWNSSTAGSESGLIPSVFILRRQYSQKHAPGMKTVPSKKKPAIHGCHSRISSTIGQSRSITYGVLTQTCLMWRLTENVPSRLVWRQSGLASKATPSRVVL
ncbi:MAG: hypothetical protein BWZ10_02311 [candidate division BRC1 bacterium ADurb.BinA364]|nr:MAG: hypothetical protein BWZ10_02311 [candidate division BRC1 bacterium ADurb.BinA364]